MKKRILKIFCISWIIFVSCMTGAMITEIVPAEKCGTILLFLAMPVIAVFVGKAMIWPAEDDDKDDSDVFLSYAYRDLPCNVYYSKNSEANND